MATRTEINSRLIPLLFLTFLTIICSGCSGMPLNAPPLEDNKIPKLEDKNEHIQSKNTALFGITSINSDVADFRPCIVVLSDASLNLITWNDKTQQYDSELSLPLSSIQSAVLVKYGTFKHIRQIHMYTELGKIALSYTVGENQKAESLYTNIVNAGVKVGTDEKYIRGTHDNVVIPVFIPTR